jgi:hypothetical protein
MRWQRCHRWSFTARLIPGARQRCADRDCLFAENCGSRSSGQAWKKESSELGLLSQRPFARSTRNIWQDCVRPPRRLTTIDKGGAVLRARAFPSGEMKRESPQQVYHNRCYILTRTKCELERTYEKGASLMRAGRLRRRRLRTSRPKRRLRKSNKSSTVSPRAIADDHETAEVEPAHSLLLSSLRFWEVKRDLIEERMTAIGH